jgi:hypothetical protein
MYVSIKNKGSETEGVMVPVLGMQLLCMWTDAYTMYGAYMLQNGHTL